MVDAFLLMVSIFLFFQSQTLFDRLFKLSFKLTDAMIKNRRQVIGGPLRLVLLIINLLIRKPSKPTRRFDSVDSN